MGLKITDEPLRLLRSDFYNNILTKSDFKVRDVDIYR